MAILAPRLNAFHQQQIRLGCLFAHFAGGGVGVGLVKAPRCCNVVELEDDSGAAQSPFAMVGSRISHQNFAPVLCNGGSRHGSEFFVTILVMNTNVGDEISLGHRMRSQLVNSKTRLINQMRAFCLEYGIAMRQGAGVFKPDIRRVIADEANDLSTTMRRLLTDMAADLQHIEMRVKAVTTEIEALAAKDDVARRLMTIPGIGTLGATALLSAMGDASRFRKARDLAAWLGLVPHQHSTGGRPNLLGISKRGNGYLRRLIISGARSCYAHLDRKHDRLGDWMNALGALMHPNKAIVAVAAKIARIAWVIITKPGALYDRRDPNFA